MDNAHAPHRAPCGTTSALCAPGWTGYLFAAALDGSPEPGHSFDAGAVSMHTSSGRVVVLDAAVAPWHDKSAVQAATGSLIQTLLEPGIPVTLLQEADGQLYDPTRRFRHDNLLFTAAVCDIDWETGSVSAAFAGDCQVWIRCGGAWNSLAPLDSLTEEARSHWNAMTAGVDHAELWDLQREYLETPSRWRCSTLGLGLGHFTTATASSSDAVIISSDGARLDAERCAELTWWLRDGIHEHPPQPPHKHPHGDLCVVFLEKSLV